MRWFITSDRQLKQCMEELWAIQRKHKMMEIVVKAGKTRSLDQNSLSHAWYAQIARELRDDDEMGWKCYCKLHHGVPILRMDDEDFKKFYDAAIKGLTYEQKLQAMKYMPITSIMTKAQLSIYLQEVQADFMRQGVMLEFPDQELT